MKTKKVFQRRITAGRFGKESSTSPTSNHVVAEGDISLADNLNHFVARLEAEPSEADVQHHLHLHVGGEMFAASGQTKEC